MAGRRPNGQLSDLERAFVREYLIDHNATAAAKRAGFGTVGRKKAYDIRSRPQVEAALAAAEQTLLHRSQLIAERVLAEIARISFGDIRAFCTWDKNGVVVRPSKDLSDDEAAMVQEVYSTTDGRGRVHVRVRLHDKLKAIELAGRSLKLWTDRLEIANADELAALIVARRHRSG